MANPALQSFEGEQLPNLTRKEQEILRRYTHVCLRIKKLSGELLASHLDLGYKAVRELKYSIVRLVKEKSNLASKFYRCSYQDIKNYV